MASAGSSSNRSYELTRLRWFPLTGPAVYIPNLWATWRPRPLSTTRAYPYWHGHPLSKTSQQISGYESLGSFRGLPISSSSLHLSRFVPIYQSLGQARPLTASCSSGQTSHFVRPWRPWSSILRRVNPSTIAGELRTFQFVANPPCFGDSILTCSRILQVCRHSGVTRVQTREELWTTNTRASFLTTNEASCTPRSSPAASFIWSVWELAGTFILLLDNLLGSLLRS